jgi:hypothetical protein
MHKHLLIALLFFGWGACAQVADTGFLKDAISASIAKYNNVIRGQTSLYSGSQYRAPKQTDDLEHPFFESDDWVYGDVVYDKKKYEHVALMYDITSDWLITENYYSAQPIVLTSEKLSRFTLGHHVFVRETDPSLTTIGFYELLYGGPSKVLARQHKLIREVIESQRIEVKFDSKTKFYLFKNGVFFSVKSKSSLLKLFEDQKQSLRQFIKKNKLQFRPDPSGSIAQVAAQYDQLKNQK